MEFIDILSSTTVPYQVWVFKLIYPFNVFQIILTKVDKVGKQTLEETKKSVEQAMSRFHGCLPNILLTSATEKIGIDDLRTEIALTIGIPNKPSNFNNTPKFSDEKPKKKNVMTAEDVLNDKLLKK